MPTKKAPPKITAKKTDSDTKVTIKPVKKPAARRSKATVKRDTKTGRIKAGVAQDTNKNGTAGAPTKYDPSYCDTIIAFFDVEKYKQVIAEEEVRETKYGKSTKRKFKTVANDLPHLESFARSIGVTYATLYNWAHEKDESGEYKRPEFFEAYNIAKQLQKEFLVENGLKGHYPPASFIFVAHNLTDMRNAKDINVKKNAGQEDDVSDEELDEAIFG